MQLNLTKSRDDKLLQDLLDKKLRVIVIFEDDYLNHIARIAYKDIQQDNYTYRIGEYSIYKGEEWGFCDFCKRHDCYFIVPNETIESEKQIQEGLEEEIEMEWDSFSKHLAEYDDDDSDEVIWLNKFSFTDIARHFAEWQKEIIMKGAVEKTVVQITRKRTPVVMLTLDANEYKDGDKVKVIICKKEG